MALTRRELLLAAAGAPFMAQANRPPNIVLIIADELAAWMLGCYGNREIRTPNIDLLARGGTRFFIHVASAPVGSPNRATLFTGRAPRQHGIRDFLTPEPIEDPPQGQAAPPPSFQDEIMISDVLARAGYNCGYAGNWDMGAEEKPQHGFTHWSTQPKTADAVTASALEFLDAQKAGKPFFLTVSYPGPHAPYEGLAAKYYEMYAGVRFETIGWDPAAPNAARGRKMLSDIVGSIRKCAAAVTAIDDQIPPLLKKLDDRGVRDDTLIVFTGASGNLLGRHGLWGGGHASNPVNMYEEATATPMIWNWRGKSPVEAARPELISSCDFLPTICEAVGAAAPQRNLPGRSYLPAVLGRQFPRNESWRNLAFSELRNTLMARNNRYKLVLRNRGEGPNELYDLRSDPREKVNQYSNPSFISVRDQLAAELDRWQKEFK
ncbi:MAG: sulfatase [Rhodospirillales bacterium]